MLTLRNHSDRYNFAAVLSVMTERLMIFSLHVMCTPIVDLPVCPLQVSNCVDNGAVKAMATSSFTLTVTRQELGATILSVRDLCSQCSVLNQHLEISILKSAC